MKELISAILVFREIYKCQAGGSSGGSKPIDPSGPRPHFPVVQVTFDHVSNVFGICLWILLGILAKISKRLNKYIVKMIS